MLIADVVGLGKTIIACAVARQLRTRGIVICPPGLRGDNNRTEGWEKYIEEFELYDWEVRSSGALEEAHEFIKDKNDFEVVIIDEAHRSEIKTQKITNSSKIYAEAERFFFLRQPHLTISRKMCFLCLTFLLSLKNQLLPWTQSCRYLQKI